MSQRKSLSSRPSKIGRSQSVERQVQIPLPLGYSYGDEERVYQDFKKRFDKEIGELSAPMVVNGDLKAILLRFLRARQYNIDNAIQMLENTVKWRQENDVDKLPYIKQDEHVVQTVRKARHSCYCGVDKMNRPIYVEKLGMLDAASIFSKGISEDQVVKYHIKEMEILNRYLLKKSSDERGKTVDSIIQIYDVSGVGLKQMSGQVKSILGKLVSTDSDNYPETNAGVYVINSSTMFQWVWRVVEPMMDPRTASKIKLFGTGNAMKKHMSELFEKDQIPSIVGGVQSFETWQQQWEKEMDSVDLKKWDDKNEQQLQANLNGKSKAPYDEKDMSGKQALIDNKEPSKDSQSQNQTESSALKGSPGAQKDPNLPRPQSKADGNQVFEEGKAPNTDDDIKRRSVFYDATSNYGNKSVKQGEQQNDQTESAQDNKQGLKKNDEDDVDMSKLQPTITLTAETLKSHREKLSTESPEGTKAIIIEDNSIDGGKQENTVTKVVDQIIRLNSRNQEDSNSAKRTGSPSKKDTKQKLAEKLQIPQKPSSKQLQADNSKQNSAKNLSDKKNTQDGGHDNVKNDGTTDAKHEGKEGNEVKNGQGKSGQEDKPNQDKSKLEDTKVPMCGCFNFAKTKKKNTK